jgi:hypothetical protein
MKKNKFPIIFKGVEVLSCGGTSFVRPTGFPKEVVCFLSKKEIKQKERIVISKTTSVSGIFLEEKRSYPIIHANISMGDLRRLLKQAEKKDKKFKHGFFLNPSPDLSLFIFPQQRNKK